MKAFLLSPNPLLKTRREDIRSVVKVRSSKTTDFLLLNFLSAVFFRRRRREIVRMKKMFFKYSIYKSILPGKDLRDGLWSRVGGS